jgi:hypothetical protein
MNLSIVSHVFSLLEFKGTFTYELSPDRWT